ncbi:MAG: hypothetical protein AAGI51_04380 [Pseudomonadota bacterium]
MAAAYGLTILDSLALMLALSPASGARRAILPFLAAQAVIAAAAVLFAALGAAALPPERLGLLGLVPLAMGVRALLAGGDAAPAPARGVWAAAVAFAALSTDGLALLSAALADGAPGRDYAVWGGAALAVAAACAAAFASARLPGAAALARRAERLAPWAMIAAGLWILADTGGDLV